MNCKFIVNLASMTWLPFKTGQRTVKRTIVNIIVKHAYFDLRFLINLPLSIASYAAVVFCLHMKGN